MTAGGPEAARHTHALPDHVQAIVDTIARERARHVRRGGRLRRSVQRAIDFLAEPVVQIAAVLLAAVWIGYNLLAPSLALPTLDPQPFNDAANAASLVALVATLMILATQRHENRLAEQRSDLMLQLAILSEQRSAKLLQLLDELRRDLPQVEHRRDAEVEALTEASDPVVVLDALRELEEQGDALAEMPPES